jgi:hypothetical protein
MTDEVLYEKPLRSVWGYGMIARRYCGVPVLTKLFFCHWLGRIAFVHHRFGNLSGVP